MSGRLRNLIWKKIIARQHLAYSEINTTYSYAVVIKEQ